MRNWFVLTLALGMAWPLSAAAEGSSESSVVPGHQSKRLRPSEARSVDIERQVIRGRVHKPHIVFHVRRVPFRFDVGTSRYSFRLEERRRASDSGR